MLHKRMLEMEKNRYVGFLITLIDLIASLYCKLPEVMWPFLFDFVSPTLAQRLEPGRHSGDVGWMTEFS